MMKLALALYSEGTTDDTFLPLIIQRTSRMILAQHGQGRVNVPEVEPMRLRQNKETRAECILEAAKQATRYQALIVHADADHPKRENALRDRILPGINLVQQSKLHTCEKLIPIIPIQSIEAWMLADHEILRDKMRTNLSADELGIPEKVKLVEGISKPKERLFEALHKANADRPRRHREINIGFLYQPMGEKVRLERLKQLTAYQQFVNDLTDVLKKLDLIQL